MFSKVSIVAATVLAALFVAQGEAGEGMMKMKCDGQDLKQSDAMKESKKACITKYAPAGETDQKKIWEAIGSNQCFHVCVFQGKGAIDAKGQYDEAGAQKAIKEFYPTEEIAKKIGDGMKACAETAGIIKAPLSMDTNCAAFKPVMECVQKTHMEVCKIKSLEEAQQSE